MAVDPIQIIYLRYFKNIFIVGMHQKSKFYMFLIIIKIFGEILTVWEMVFDSAKASRI
jgi:hypothetical protein